MRILVLGQGKTGKLVSEVAAQRGHGVHVLDVLENSGAGALTPPFVAGFDVAIDFTTPEAVVQNMRACLATGAKMVVGTTGWYAKLAETRHVTKVDKPSGTAISIAEMVERGAGKKFEVPIESVREGDAKGTHALQALSEADRLVLTHEAFSRRGFAEGAVRAAEWLAGRTGCYDFRDVWEKL